MKRLGAALAILYVLAWAATVGAHAVQYDRPGYVSSNTHPAK